MTWLADLISGVPPNRPVTFLTTHQRPSPRSGVPLLRPVPACGGAPGSGRRTRGCRRYRTGGSLVVANRTATRETSAVSQVRETAVFSGLPITERCCGVWAVDVATGR